jgi:Fe-S cluster biogenesis protein NfuA
MPDPAPVAPIAPEEPSVVEAALLEAVEAIRPALQSDGGDMRVLELDQETGRVDIELMGACGGCPMSSMTLKAGIERILKDRVPGLTEVRAKGIDFDVDPSMVGGDDW